MKTHGSSLLTLLVCCQLGALVGCAHDVSLGSQSFAPEAGAAGGPVEASGCAGTSSGAEDPAERRCQQTDETDRQTQDSDAVREDNDVGDTPASSDAVDEAGVHEVDNRETGTESDSAYQPPDDDTADGVRQEPSTRESTTETGEAGAAAITGGTRAD